MGPGGQKIFCKTAGLLGVKLKNFHWFNAQRGTKVHSVIAGKSKNIHRVEQCSHKETQVYNET